MITFTILLLTAMVLLTVLIITVGIGGLVVIIPYIDILACVAIVALIVRAVVRKHKKG